jgi:H+-translocating NAD(P) transhydrogenase subunit alpha
MKKSKLYPPETDIILTFVFILKCLHLPCMKIGTIKESKAGENRVALSPDVVKNLVKQGFECFVESGAGVASNFSDDAYKSAGAIILGSAVEVCNSTDVIVKVNAPSKEEIGIMKEGSALLSFIYHLSNPELVEQLNARKLRN